MQMSAMTSNGIHSKNADRMPTWVFLSLFFGAFILRLCGLLTATNGDENWHASARVLAGDISGDAGLNMPLVNYLNAASFVVLYAFGRLVGVWNTLGDFRAQYFADQSPFILSGRLVAASLGALSAPLAALIARRLRLTHGLSIAVGALVGLLPINELVSHFARPDVGAATAVLFLCWTILRKLDDPESTWGDVLVGIAVALALSIKQTNVFVVIPLVVGYAALLLAEKRISRSRVARAAIVSILTSFVVAAPLTIGVLIDLRGFLDYQRVSAAINTRPTTFAEFVSGSVPFFLDNIGGLTAAGLIAYLAAPFARRDARFLILWGSAAIGFCGFSYLAGRFISPRYVLPFAELAFTCGCIGLASALRRTRMAWSVAAIVLGALVLGSEMLGTETLVREGLAAPISTKIADVISKNADPAHDKILSNVSSRYGIGLPVSVAALEDEFDRNERLGKKYNIPLNETPEERQKGSRRDRLANVYYVRPFPVAMGGMEEMDKEQAEKVVKPYYWPVQDEEWSIDYWKAQGITIFVVQDEDFWLKINVPAYRRLHEQIKERGQLIATIPSTRPHFFEAEVKIYRVR